MTDQQPTDGVDARRERFAEVRGEHGWARYVEDDVLAAWLGLPAPEPAAED